MVKISKEHRSSSDGSYRLVCKLFNQNFHGQLNKIRHKLHVDRWQMAHCVYNFNQKALINFLQ